MTEFESHWLSEYLVRTWLVGIDSYKWKVSIMLIRVSLYREWNLKLGSQLQSLMLKLPVMMRTLLILTSVSLRYFKANCDESEYTLIKKYTEIWLKKEIQKMFLWLRISFCNKKQRWDSLMLMHIMTLGESSIFEGFLEKVIQFGWLDTPTSSSSLQFFELSNKKMKDYEDSWIKTISNKICILRIVLITKLFLQIFCKRILMSFKIILEWINCFLLLWIS